MNAWCQAARAVTSGLTALFRTDHALHHLVNRSSMPSRRHDHIGVDYHALAESLPGFDGRAARSASGHQRARPARNHRSGLRRARRSASRIAAAIFRFPLPSNGR